MSRVTPRLVNAIYRELDNHRPGFHDGDAGRIATILSSEYYLTLFSAPLSDTARVVVENIAAMAEWMDDYDPHVSSRACLVMVLLTSHGTIPVMERDWVGLALSHQRDNQLARQLRIHDVYGDHRDGVEVLCEVYRNQQEELMGAPVG